MTVAGDLRERVAFEFRPTTDDGFGNEETDEWSTAFTVAARIKPARGAESIQAARLAGKEPVVITIRVSLQTRNITTSWRARDVRKGTLYNIRSIVNPDERRAYLDMECDSGTAV